MPPNTSVQRHGKSKHCSGRIWSRPSYSGSDVSSTDWNSIGMWSEGMQMASFFLRPSRYGGSYTQGTQWTNRTRMAIGCYLGLKRALPDRHSQSIRNCWLLHEKLGRMF